MTEGANQDYTYAISKNGTSVSLADILDQEEYTVTVTGHGNYTGTKTAAFTPQYFNGNGGTISPTTQRTDTLFTVTGTAIASFYNNLLNTDALTITLTDSTSYAIGTDMGNITGSAVTGVKVNEAVYIQEQSSGAISKYTVTEYAEDTREPEISIVTSNNWDTWAKKDESKTFTVTATDDNGLYSGKVYYSTGEKVITASQYTDEATLKADLQNTSLTAIESGDTITVTDDLDETGVSYYVYAIDSAGNVATKEINVNKIDQKEPTVAIAYDTYKNTAGNDYYYQQSNSETYEKVTLTYTEANFNTTGASKPVIYYSTDGGTSYTEVTVTAASEQELTAYPAVIWTWDGSTDQATATVYLGYGQAEETGYLIATSYTDVAGNVLTSSDNNLSDLTGSVNGYVSNYTLVLDNKVPEITDFTISGNDLQGNSGDYERISKSAVTLSWTIEDNAKYWDSMNEAAVSVTVYMKVANEADYSVYTGNYSITWDTTGDLHTATCKFDGDTSGTVTYYVSVSYQDRATNKMVNSASTGSCLSEGTYTSPTFILDYTTTDSNVSTQTTVQVLSELPEGLKSLYSSVDALVSDLISRVTVNAGYTADNALVYDVVLQYSTDGGTTWTTATVDNFPTTGITVTLPYPNGTDSSYEFTVLHMFTETSSRLNITAGGTETPTITKTEDGLVFTLTGLSPVAISWKEGAVTAETKAEENKTGTETADTDTSSQIDDSDITTAETTETTTSVTSANSTTVAPTGDSSNMVLWLILLFIAGFGIFGVAAYSIKKKHGR